MTNSLPCGAAILTLLTLAAAVARPAAAAEASPFGENVLVVDPADAGVQRRVDEILQRQQNAEFGTARYAVLLKPGEHDLDVRVGYYTQVLGLGRTPDDVHVRGAVRAVQPPGKRSALVNFWRSAENFSVTPSEPEKSVWAVSQAAPMRRVHVRGDLALSQAGYSSGGFIADSQIDGTVNSGTQQQYLLRNCAIGGWTGGAWNMVFVGVPNAPAQTWPERPYTAVARTPLVREKPFLTFGADGYALVVPGLRRDSAGPSWADGEDENARVLPLNTFHVARPGVDDAASLNAALEAGKHLLFTPGIYDIAEPIRVRRAGTVLYGLGYATLVATGGRPAITVDDVPGVTLAGLLVQAGGKESPVLVQVGPPDSTLSHADDPTALFDLFARSGGPAPGRCGAFVEINSSDVIADHLWLWRADHGRGAAWDENPTANGVIVNGDRVTVYGLFVEHTQGYQTLWNGEDGRVFLYQSEMPYDPPTQAAWGNDGRGFASYKVGEGVQRHEAVGLGIYCVFKHAPIVAATAVEAPERPGVRFRNLIAVRLGGTPGGIRAVLNDRGEPAVKDDGLVTSRLSGDQPAD